LLRFWILNKIVSTVKTIYCLKITKLDTVAMDNNI